MSSNKTFRDIAFNIAFLILSVIAVGLACGGCTSYDGGKVVDGTNLAIGIKIPGTNWNFSVLDYISGCRVAGDRSTHIIVSNEVVETNHYFGVVTTERHTKMSADIEPLDTAGKEEETSL